MGRGGCHTVEASVALAAVSAVCARNSADFDTGAGRESARRDRVTKLAGGSGMPTVSDPVRAENPIRPAQATMWYSWMRPPRRSVFRSLATSTSPMVGGATPHADGERWLRER